MKAAIYLIRGAGKVKIGYSKNPWARYRQLCTGSPINMALVMTLYLHNAPKAERELHKAFESQRVNGEWFNVSISEVMGKIIELGILETDYFCDHGLIGEESTPEENSEPCSKEELDEFFSDMGAFLTD